MSDVDFRALPKAVLHDHIDGGLRPLTVLELAAETAYNELPATDEEGLADWFHQADASHLIEYLDAFRHTVGVLQAPEGLERVAYECVVDLHADGVVYAEVRFGPSLHRRGGMSDEDALEAVLAGLARGSADTGLEQALIVTALRTERDSLTVAKAAARFAGEGVVAFDLAGPEAGYPADDHLAACRLARESGLVLTIHAGEQAGPESIWRALGRCGAQRLGHGARIIDDCVVADGEIVELGPLARTVRDQRIPLEIAITSNVHTRLARSAAEHPAGMLANAGFLVTLNTDNRLMSATTQSAELATAHHDLGFSVERLGSITEKTIRAGFGDWSARRRLISDVVRPAYSAVAAR